MKKAQYFITCGELAARLLTDTSDNLRRILLHLKNSLKTPASLPCSYSHDHYLFFLRPVVRRLADLRIRRYYRKTFPGMLAEEGNAVTPFQPKLYIRWSPTAIKLRAYGWHLPQGAGPGT